MSTSDLFSRRGFVAAGAVAAIAAASPVLAAERTPIARAWARAEALRRGLAPHGRAIVAAFRSGGVPGWMRLKGEAYALGETRYGLIVEILNAAPTSAADLEIQRRAARDPECGWPSRLGSGPADACASPVAARGVRREEGALSCSWAARRCPVSISGTNSPRLIRIRRRCAWRGSLAKGRGGALASVPARAAVR